ncbi:hypothetical protein DOTSEDRAFT_68899 [Dothistroma septosporum NZE10]|uniref:Meiotic expression up-regulated protein 6 PH domain-containing protein n=1 Tax=Dothistroma septosporum (strain NZE10 / CBS 128990) TaxID=675120 RepID=N1Q4E9_DOTSN|nr:hypothetical protein DOTSEDRAFT_68899 [Dothistroma septosporum NZE10]
MSAVQDTTTTTTPVPVTEASHAAPVAVTTDAAPAVPEPAVGEQLPKAETEVPTEAAAAPVEETKADAVAEKAVEPITEGLLGYKAPGVLKGLIASKKQFWLNDEAVSPQHLDLFMRGEKPEVSHAIVAWASQTGKGLLFFNKKHDTDRTHPQDVLALYDATDLKKAPTHEITMEIHSQKHTLKATSDAERDGWYLSIEKAIELGKASKEEIHNSEAYKAEVEKLNKPSTVLGAGSAKRAQSQPKKSTEVNKETGVERTGSSSSEEENKEKKQKSRSTSRGLLGRLQGKKDEAEQKVAEKKEEKEIEKEIKKTDEEQTPVLASTEAAPVAGATAAAAIPAAVEANETATETAVIAEGPSTEPKIVEDKPKPTKRGSIFGKVQGAWSSVKSPSKEKELKDVELKPEAGKEVGVSETAPVLPETATVEPVTAIPAVEEPAVETKAEEKKEATVDTPTKEKSNFLSGLGFMKRNRSVSPSTHMKEPAKKEETSVAAAATEGVAVTEPVKETTEETRAVDTTAETEKPVVSEPVSEKTEETIAPNKRQSMLGSLGRRASKALNRINTPKKENAAPVATEAKKEEATEVKPTEEIPIVNGEAKTDVTEEPKAIGDVVPEAVNVGQPQHTTPTVTASA